MIANQINIDSYSWFGHNRKHILPSARRGSGGVGLLVKDHVNIQFQFLTLTLRVSCGYNLLALIHMNLSVCVFVTCRLPTLVEATAPLSFLITSSASFVPYRILINFSFVGTLMQGVII